jgi:hypothetical protein
MTDRIIQIETLTLKNGSQVKAIRDVEAVREALDGIARLELARPVKCAVCKGQMYYTDDPRHEPEGRIIVETQYTSPEFYAHTRCLEEWLKEIGGL